MTGRPSERRPLLCPNIEGDPASPDVRKVDAALPDAAAGARGLVRVVGESGGDYLDPAAFSVPIVPPKAAAALIAGKA